MGIESAILGGAGISAGTGLIGSVLGYFGQKQANDAYLEGIDKTNEQNYQIWQEQKQHNVDMFNMQNEANIANWQNQFDQTNAYNSASAQRKRLEEAGLNPAMMMSGGSAGTASSSGIPSSSVNPSPAPTMQAPQQMQSPLTKAVEMGLQSFGTTFNSVTQGVQANDLIATRQPRIDVMKSDARAKDWQGRVYQSQHALNRQEYEFNSLAQNIRLDYMRSLNISQNLSNEHQEILVNWLGPEKAISFLSSQQNLYNLWVHGELTYEQWLNEVKRGFNIDADTNLKKSESSKNYSDIEVNDAKKENLEEDTKGKKTANKIADETAESVVNATIKANEATETFEGARKKYYQDENNAKDYFRWQSGKYSRGKNKSNIGFNIGIAKGNWEFVNEDGY